MKKLFPFFMFLGLTLISESQVIKGTVFDKTNKSAIGYASLYFTGTFNGTTTDQKGNFELDISKNKNMPLTVSAIGFYSVTVTDFQTDQPMQIFMEPKVYQLNEVAVKSRSLAGKRKANLITFREVFLGTTENSRNCFITNENDISFNYDTDRDTLKAFATRPLEIENKSLGYKITYYLDKFEFDRNNETFIFKGDMIYKEDLSIDSEQKKSYERKRKYAYLGSRMHFFRALWQNKLYSSGFIVKNSSGVNLTGSDIVTTSEGNKKYLRYFENLGICYYSEKPKSGLTFLITLVFFDATGYYDPAGIQWEGYMATQRIADWLPYEYFPEL